MRCDVRVEGLDDLVDAIDKLGGEAACTRMRKNAGRKLAKRARAEMKKHVPVSGDNARSGTRGNRPVHGHARDNIPATVRTKDGDTYVDVGWRISDNSEYFYMKFVEWGTHGTHPQPAKRFLEKTLDALGDVPGEIVKDECILTLKAAGIDVEE